jgi:hypothetical protein
MYPVSLTVLTIKVPSGEWSIDVRYGPYPQVSLEPLIPPELVDYS